MLQAQSAIGYLCFHEDITSERMVQQRAAQALYDPLTNLLNRSGLFEALADALQRAAQQAETVALMFVDLDDFKRANDVGGHRTGDEILIAVGAALAAEMCGAVAARVVGAIARLRFQAGEELLTVGCSVGFAAYPRDATVPDELVACADMAMYQAKQQGKNGWRAFQRGQPQAAGAHAARNVERRGARRLECYTGPQAPAASY